MSGYFIDVGWQSQNKHGELLCGDRVEVTRDRDSVVVVLADGLGSGVKANILSTLTSKIISTMIANNMSIRDCVMAVAATLPVCDVRKIAYSTFTIIHMDKSMEAEIIQFDNPHVILLRDGKYTQIQEIAEHIDGKTIYKSNVKLRENDTFIAVSDGVIHAGTKNTLNYEWERDDVARFMENTYKSEYSAKTLTTMLSDQCLALYENEPSDDMTVCTVKVQRRAPVNLLIGPPADPADVNTMMSLFFSKEGKHIVCGGTTAELAAEYLGKPLRASAVSNDNLQAPPTSEIEGVDLVTEGVITASKALEYIQDYLTENSLYGRWSRSKDGAAQIAKILIEEATDINFFVGRAVNPAHQKPGLTINFSIKMRIVEELAETLQKMGKYIKVSYF